MKKAKVRIGKNKKLPVLFTGLSFGIIGLALLVNSLALTPIPYGIPAAANPKMALGVGGTPRDSFANWLDRRDQPIKYTESNKHFNPGIKKSLENVGGKNNDTTTVITFSLAPDQTNYLKNTNAASICGTDYVDVAEKYEGLPLATNKLGNAKVDINNNGIKDNVENLYRTYKGCYDNTFKFLGDAVYSSGAYKYNPNGSPKLIIRLGHEHDGDFYEWSSVNQTDANAQKALDYAEGKTAQELYKLSYQRAHSIITSSVKSRDPNGRVYFEWNGTSQMAVGDIMEKTYPGNEYVDVIGTDFYDRLYSVKSNACIYDPTVSVKPPDCRTQSEKEAGWSKLLERLNIIEAFAINKGKIMGISEVHGSSALSKASEQPRYWQHGADNDYFVQQVYNWTKRLTSERKLAYIIFFERNPSYEQTKETGLKGYHKISPGMTNQLNIPSNDVNATCKLSWDFGGTDGVQSSNFPKAAVQFLKLWSGPAEVENKKGSHQNCKDIGVVDTGNVSQNVKPNISIRTVNDVVVNSPINFTADITDDGLPAPSNTNITWSKVSGPGSVTFSPNSSSSTRQSFLVNTQATFTQAGNYTIQATANDGSLSNTATLNVTVQSTPTTNTGTQQVLVDTTIGLNATTKSFEDIDFNRINNWTTPNALSTGMVFARLDVLNIPVNNSRELSAQVCFYKNSGSQSLCSEPMKFSDSGPMYAKLGSPASNRWAKTGNWDFTTPIENSKIIVKDVETNNQLLTVNCGSSCTTGEIFQEATPLVVHLQVVAVPRGKQIIALDNWLYDASVCPVDFGCTPTAARPTKPLARLRHPSKLLSRSKSQKFFIDAMSDRVISKVELINKNNNQVLGSTTTEPYEITLNTLSLRNGNYTLVAKVYDNAGNSSESSAMTFKLRQIDIDRSGKADLADVAFIVANWNVSGGNTLNTESDLNDDNKINEEDLNLVMSNWER